MRRPAKECCGRIPAAVGLVVLGVLAGAVAMWAAENEQALGFAAGKNGVPAGWELFVNAGEANLALVPDGNGRALELRSEASSFSLQRKVAIDLTRTPFVVWQWKVTELPKRGDFRHRATDDQAAQLYVVFSWEVFRKEAIAYIWDSTAPEGTTAQIPSPVLYPFLNLHVVVLRSGEAERGRWITETRNVAEDYRKLFGAAPGKVRGLMIQINSQHTESRAEAHWRSIRFTPYP
jgi:hypothetical protein